MTPCIHLGPRIDKISNDVGGTTDVFACEMHQRCTIKRRQSDTIDCEHCGDYTASGRTYAATRTEALADRFPQSLLLGDVVKSALDSVGITRELVERLVGPECNCDERREKLNQLDLWARGVVKGTVQNAKAQFDSLFGIGPTGISDQPVASQPTEAATSMEWAYGVTTVPQRFNDLLPRTLASLREAGFPLPRLFVDGDAGPLPEPLRQYPLTERKPKVKALGNWVLSIYELYLRQPYAQRYAIFQDDFVTYRNLRDYLERSPYPADGYLNLMTFMENEQVISGKPVGWYESMINERGQTYHGKKQQGGRGAVALVFDRTAVQVLLASPHIVRKPAGVGDRSFKFIDGGIVESMNQAGWREYVHSPSLVMHTGLQSTLGNQAHRPIRSFRGERFDALDLLKE